MSASLPEFIEFGVGNATSNSRSADGSCQLEFGGEGQVISCAQLLSPFAANSEQLLDNRLMSFAGHYQ